MPKFKINVHISTFLHYQHYYFIAYVRSRSVIRQNLKKQGLKMILLSRFIYDEEIRNLRQEIKKLKEENLNLKNKLENSINNEFELAFKLEAINNYITILEAKLRG